MVLDQWVLLDTICTTLPKHQGTNWGPRGQLIFEWLYFGDEVWNDWFVSCGRNPELRPWAHQFRKWPLSGVESDLLQSTEALPALRRPVSSQSQQFPSVSWVSKVIMIRLSKLPGPTHPLQSWPCSKNCSPPPTETHVIDQVYFLSWGMCLEFYCCRCFHCF